MKYLKVVVLWTLAITVPALFAVPASATTLMAPVTAIEAESEGWITMDGPENLECKSSTFEMKVEQSGAGVTAKGKLSSLSFEGCNAEIAVLVRGSLEIHALGNGNGTVTWHNGRINVLINTIFGTIECDFATAATHFGTITTGGSATATLDLEEALIPVVESNPLCGTGWEWTGSYSLTPRTSDSLSVL